MKKDTNSLNETLKAREAAQRGGSEAQHQTLDDTQRVKVLSPGRLVSKRFFRNKLALAGLGILIVMFAFSFLCPLFYPYGQTDIFYKYDVQTVDYAVATERTQYVSYAVDPSVDVHYSVKNMMTAYIAEMEADNQSSKTVTDKNGVSYVLRRQGEGVYTVQAPDRELVATVGSSQLIGNFNNLSRTFDNAPELPEGAEAAVAAAIADGSLACTVGEDDFIIVKAEGKFNYTVSRSSRAVEYAGAAPGEGFDEAFRAALGGDSFTFGGTTYILVTGEDGVTGAYTEGSSATALVCSVFVFDSMEQGGSFSDAFKAQALLALYADRSFTADGTDYDIVETNDTYYIYDDTGAERAMMGTLAVRRYSGDDTLPLDFKSAAAEKVEAMEDAGETNSSYIFALPQLGDTAEYVYDENGQLHYVDTEISVSYKSGQYLLSCEQTIHLIDIYAPPSAEHIFGTDADGMDILARMMYGGRVSLMVGFVVVIIESILGVIMGGVAGYFGGWVDTLIMRLVDIFYCIPTYPILIIMGAFFDSVRMSAYQRLLWMMVTLGVLGWAGVARLVRGQILSLREQEFMVAAEATGIGTNRRIFKHLVPNVMPQLIVSATMGLGSVIITESTLSFLGLGVKHPLATWGTMINSITSSNENLVRYAYIWIPVGLLICLTVIAFNFVGDGLRDAFDPKMKQ